MGTFDNYECSGQLDIFNYIEKPSSPIEERYDPIEDYARRGSGFRGGKKRIREYFAEYDNLNDRANFLKNEYGIGGFSKPCGEPYMAFSGWADASGCKLEYYDADMKRIALNISYKQLALAVDRLIKTDRYRGDD